MNAMIPRPTDISRPFWEGLREQRILIPRCQRCRGWVFYPRRHCTHCASHDLAWTPVSGAATLCSFTIARVPTLPGFAGPELQNLAIVTFSEGFNMNSALTGVTPDDMCIGMPLRPVFDVMDDAGHARLLFTAA